MSPIQEDPCQNGLTPECFESHPEWAIQAFSVRLLYLFLPVDISEKLLRSLKKLLFPPDVIFPPVTPPTEPPGIVTPPTEPPPQILPTEPGITVPVTPPAEPPSIITPTLPPQISIGIGPPGAPPSIITPTLPPQISIGIGPPGAPPSIITPPTEPGITVPVTPPAITPPPGWTPGNWFAHGALRNPNIGIYPNYLVTYKNQYFFYIGGKTGASRSRAPVPSYYFHEPWKVLDPDIWTVTAFGGGTITVVGNRLRMYCPSISIQGLKATVDTTPGDNFDVTFTFEYGFGYKYWWIEFYTGKYRVALFLIYPDEVDLRDESGLQRISVDNFASTVVSWKLEIRDEEITLYQDTVQKGSTLTMQSTASWPGQINIKMWDKATIYMGPLIIDDSV